jgi:uncharacterized membrane protein
MTSAPRRSTRVEQGDLPQPGVGERAGVRATVRLLGAFAAGSVVGAAVSVPATWRYGLLIGWATAAAVFLTWIWASIGRMDAPTTARHAVREDPGRPGSDAVVLAAAVASLGAVGLLLTGGAPGGGSGRNIQATLSVVSVALAWASVHTVFTTRYARLYYTGPDGGIDFNEEEPPRYLDFAYLAFTIGMTFQVSDTDLTTKVIRATALVHALLSYLFGAVIIATTINLIAGLSR